MMMRASSSGSRFRSCCCSRGLVACASQPSRRSAPSPPLESRLATAGLAAALSLCLLTGTAQAAELKTLADIVRGEAASLDANKDGLVTLDELQQLGKRVSEEESMPQPLDAELAFTMKLFDLNQDGKLTTDETLTSLALDSVVRDSDKAIEADAIKVFDRNGDGLVDRSEWSAPFGELQPQGEAVKTYVFDRVDHLSNGDGKLDLKELTNGLTLVRTLTLGY